MESKMYIIFGFIYMKYELWPSNQCEKAWDDSKLDDKKLRHLTLPFL